MPTKQTKPVRLSPAQAREAQSECLEVIETLRHGSGVLSVGAAELLLTVLQVHLLALGFKRKRIPISKA